MRTALPGCQHLMTPATGVDVALSSSGSLPFPLPSPSFPVPSPPVFPSLSSLHIPPASFLPISLPCWSIVSTPVFFPKGSIKFLPCSNKHPPPSNSRSPRLLSFSCLHSVCSPAGKQNCIRLTGHPAGSRAILHGFCVFLVMKWWKISSKPGTR